MPDYQAMYIQLAGKVADAAELLIEALQQGEDQYVTDERQQLLTLLRDTWTEDRRGEG